MNVYQNLSTCCIWNLYGWILRSKDEHVFCWSVCQFKKQSHIRMFVGRSVLGPVPWWMQTFRAAPSSKPLMMCHETISARARFCVQPYGQGQNKSKFYPQMGRFGMVGGCYPQIPPKNHENSPLWGRWWLSWNDVVWRSSWGPLRVCPLEGLSWVGF